MLNHLREHILIYVTVIILAILGIVNSSDYGVTWDENHQRTIGLTSYDYVFNNDQRLKTFGDRDYGVGVELPLIMLEKAMGLTEYNDIYQSRHIATHLFYLVCALSLYFLCCNLFQSRVVAFIAFLFLVLHPRLYAHSFFNSKDIPFMCVYAVCLWQFQRTFSKMSIVNLLLLGAATGYLMNLRIMGVLFFVCCLGFFVLNCLSNSGQSVLRRIANVCVYGIVTLATTYLGWPYLWDDPVGNFVAAFQNMSKFRWDGVVLFGGDIIKATEVPWHYIPTWFGITTPEIVLVLGCLGLVFTLLGWFKKPVTALFEFKNRNLLLYAATFLGAVSAVIVLHSVLYDGWRQMYFIYPSFVMLAAYGLSRILELKKKIITIPVAALLCLQGGAVAVFMYQAHPFQQVYFNTSLPRWNNYIRENYEFDYWGSSLKAAFEYILKTDPGNEIRIHANAPAKENYLLLSPQQRARIKLTIADSIDKESKGYFISYYRFHPWEYLWLTPIAEKIYEKKILNNGLFAIWKYRGPEEDGEQLVTGAGAVVPKISRFVQREDGTVLDSVTGLMWAAEDNGHDINWYDARDYCNKLTLGGYSDWRLPTQAELAALFGAGVRTTDSPGESPISISNWWVWTRESRASGRSGSFVMKFGYKRESYKSVSYFYRAVPVRNAGTGQINEAQPIVQ